MDLVLYKNFSVANKLTKNITAVASFPGVQLIQPLDRYQSGQAVQAVNDGEVSVRMTVPTDDLRWDHVNYFEWDGAYYFLTSVDKVANGISVINGEMDLLMTYREGIKGLNVKLRRSTSHGTSRAEDELRQYSVSSDRAVALFPKKFGETENTGSYVFVTSQKGYQ